MRKIYEEPEISIRTYALPSKDVVMTSKIDGNDLDTGDDVVIPRTTEPKFFGE